MDYFQDVKKIINLCNKYNIQVLLVPHHELYSGYFCGHGFPDWAFNVTSFPKPLKIEFRRDMHGYPFQEDCKNLLKIDYYMSEDVQGFSEDFLTNVNGLSDKFAEFWAKASYYFKDCDNLLGYEIMNTPWGSSFFRHPSDAFRPQHINNNYILPFYKKINLIIRK